ncbi:MAG: PHP domain-containing protein [Oscillospiraceae bacterium]|nr:PHP domain-containing protein [Oscillospiraceae bacterium]
MKILFDTHTHSNLSDGANSPSEMLRAANKRGLKVLALTDHFDLHKNFPKELSMFDGGGREKSYLALSRTKKASLELDSPENTATIFLKGVEIGQAHHFKEYAESWLNSHEYDMILGSCHIIRNKGDFYHMDYSKPENAPDTVLKQYFEELIELCEWCGEFKKTSPKGDKAFDVLAHLTYPLRYMKAKGVDASVNEHLKAIDTLFEIMVKHEIALEINTQTYLQSIICPELTQVKRFREFGGKLITIGSDAHNADTLAQGLNHGIKIAKAAGFNECVYYEERQPKSIQI